MTVQLDKHLLFSTFGVDSFNELESYTQSMAPSMVEYYLNDLATTAEEQNSYINRSNIQQTINFDDYSLYMDYGDLIYLEVSQNGSNDETGSLW